MFIRPYSLSKEQQQEIIRRLWEKETSLWTSDPETAATIANRLGWLDVIETMEGESEEIKRFAGEIAARDIKTVLLLGMGGSTLCPLVVSKVFPQAEGYPSLKVLDTTDPDEVERAAESYSFSDSLVIVASKSGSTMEPDALFSIFWDLASKESDSPGKGFIAITDPGSPLEKLAKERDFLRIFSNPSDIGGRYSALSMFGLVPAALQGVDIDLLLKMAKETWRACGPENGLDENPGWKLCAFRGELAAPGGRHVHSAA